jgi:hypothetical protein
MEEQCGLREGRGCNDAIYCLRSIMEMAKRKEVNMHACFVDLSKAYYSVVRRLA